MAALRLAHLVGSVILEFGTLDQFVWRAIGTLEMKKRKLLRYQKLPYNYHQTPDYGFKQRCTKIRKLLVELGADNRTLSDFDKIRTEIIRLERIRGHLAHGSVLDKGDKVEIIDMREGYEELAAQKAASRRFGKWLKERNPLTSTAFMEKAHAVFGGLIEKHRDIFYSENDLVDAAAQIKDVADQLLITVETFAAK